MGVKGSQGESRRIKGGQLESIGVKGSQEESVGVDRSLWGLEELWGFPGGHWRQTELSVCLSVSL